MSQQQLTSDLRKHPELLNASESEMLESLMQENFTLPNISTLLEQLDTIDNAACGWIQFMSKVGLRYCYEVDTLMDPTCFPDVPQR